ncbi:hypothetical protein GCM10017044_05080 [Kordiimonas sediminis]|uniref:TonB-dependent receptor n=1 Tax=Kordiimonas sediminis TaxID=1735581 RepID=A0A919E4U4_9PROT|nr:TonB-dependent receptor [Kordiimonas sediminis]GHF13975.1 hypothetical protein GCM10017044_05080 [Kordiimonas sediminis]
MRNSEYFKKLLLGSVAAGVLAAPNAPVMAAEEEEVASLEEIYVTARKRQELIVEVPMNIAAVGETEILKRNLVTKEEIFRSVAGAASPRGELILRGLAGGNDSTPGTTSTFTDGIPYDFSNLYDIERVEVLRGPQGTLYGSNAIGGTVRVITKKPNLNEMEIGGSALFLSEKNRPGVGVRGSGYVNIPVVEDKLAFRVTGSAAKENGKILNTYTNNTGTNEDHFIRAQALWAPNEDTKVNLSFVNSREYSSTRSDADRSTPDYYYEAILTANPDAKYGYDVAFDFPSCPEGTERSECRGGQLNGHDPKFAVWQIMDPFVKTTSNLVVLNVEKYNLVDGVDLEYSGSWRRNTYDGRQSGWSQFDANDMFRTWIIDKDGNDRWTHELRLQSNGEGPLQWTVGGFYDKDIGLKTPDGQWQYHASDNKSRAIAAYLWGEYWGLGDPTQIGLDLYGDPTKNYNYTVHKWNTRELAFFGEAGYTFDLKDAGKLEVTGGLRYYDLKDDLHDEVSGIWIGDEPQETITKDGESGTRKKISVNWMPSNDFAVFAIYSEGYRPGGNNGPNAPADCRNDENIGSYTDRYSSDKIKNYEIGFKGFAFDRKVQFSSAVYQIDWTDVQAVVYMPSCGFSYTANAASARSRGLEFESTTTITDSLKLILNAAYTDSKMTSDVESLGAKDGDDMTMVPKYNFYAALDQEFELYGREASVRLDVAGYGEYKSHFNTKDSDVSPAYEVVNLSGSIQINENARLSLHVNNVLNTNIITYRRSRSRSDWSGNTLYETYGDQRNLAVRLDFTF